MGVARSPLIWPIGLAVLSVALQIRIPLPAERFAVLLSGAAGPCALFAIGLFVSQLSIRVDALDSAGRVVESITTPPLQQTIAALGGQATFEAWIPRNPAITTYHAVAIAR